MLSCHHKPLRSLIAVCAVAFTLSACQMSPLYAPHLSTHQKSSRHEVLKTVQIQNIESRAGVRLKTALLKRGVSSENATNFHYSLKTTLKAHNQWVAVEAVSGRPSTIFYTLKATITLKDNRTDETIFKRSLSAHASYDWSGQRFGNDRAANGAERRSVESLADQIKTLLSVELSQQNQGR